jgi:alpha-L-fucosidase 2
MKEVALFYEDFLVSGPDGRLQFSPSLSPENTPAIAEPSLVTVNATMDVAVARELLGNLCQACDRLDCEAEGVCRWRSMLARLPDYQVNEDGALREWLHPDLKDNYHQRHLSHLYPVFPGLEVTKESDPVLFAAARVAVEKRLVIGLTSQTGWSLAHLACTYARLGEGDRALECLELLTRSCVGPNLFTYHNDWRSQGVTMFWGPGSRPPFQIDANLGFTAAILEMLAFTTPDMIKVLPALPRRWPSGRIIGLRCRGGGELDLAWKQRSLRLRLRCPTKRDVTLCFPRPVRNLRSNLPTGSVTASPLGPAYRRVRLPAGREVRIDVGF